MTHPMTSEAIAAAEIARLKTRVKCLTEATATAEKTASEFRELIEELRQDLRAALCVPHTLLGSMSGQDRQCVERRTSEIQEKISAALAAHAQER